MDNLFQMPADGWVQIAAMGEFPHKPSGKVQIIDARACAEMVDAFTQDALAPNFGGVLIDQDHFSLDPEKSSEAMGWITALEARDDGLWAQVRWTDSGRAAVEGGRYRFISPVWTMADCAKLGEKKIRPRRLKNCALTNDPNIKGMAPLSNRAAPEDVAGWVKKPEPTPPPPRPIVSNRTARAIGRASLAARGVYILPGGDFAIVNRRPLSRQQEIAIIMKTRAQGMTGPQGAHGAQGMTGPQGTHGAQGLLPTQNTNPIASPANDDAPAPTTGHSWSKTTWEAKLTAQNVRKLADYIRKSAAYSAQKKRQSAQSVIMEAMRPLPNRGAMPDDPGRAMFARMSAGGAPGRGRTSAGELPGDVGAADASVSPQAGSYGDAGTAGPQGQTSSTPDPFRPSIGITESVRESAARVALRQQNIENLEATRQAAPVPAKRDLVDTGALRADLMKQGKGPTEILEALRNAESQNASVKQTAAALRAMARRAYPGRPDKQKKYIDDFLQEQDDAFNKALAAWKRDDDKISRAIVKEKVAISEEEIRAREEMNRSAVRQMKMDASTEARAATEAARLERQQAAIRADVEKRAATAAATKARDEYKAAEAAAREGDPVRRAKADKAKRALYWGEVAAGNVAAAAALFPQANTAGNAAVVKRIQDALSAAGDDTKARTTHRNALALITTKQP